jgi:hypothetical protein
MKIKTMFTILLLSTFFNPAFASSIENMERTRASFIKVMLDSNLNLEKKELELKNLKLKLLDKERIVINDKKIIQNPSRYTIKAFEQFDSSSSKELKKLIINFESKPNYNDLRDIRDKLKLNNFKLLTKYLTKQLEARNNEGYQF